MGNREQQGNPEGVRIELCEPIVLTDRESRALQDLRAWQDQAAKSSYVFTDKPVPDRVNRLELSYVF